MRAAPTGSTHCTSLSVLSVSSSSLRHGPDLQVISVRSGCIPCPGSDKLSVICRSFSTCSVTVRQTKTWTLKTTVQWWNKQSADNTSSLWQSKMSNFTFSVAIEDRQTCGSQSLRMFSEMCSGCELISKQLSHGCRLIKSQDGGIISAPAALSQTAAALMQETFRTTTGLYTILH